VWFISQAFDYRIEIPDTVRLEQENPAIHYRELVRDGVHTLIAVNVEPDLALDK
jgi:hypothetical protein